MFKEVKLELIFWISGLIILLTIDPSVHYFTFCPLENLGFTWCPGCGLGRSIAYLFQGNYRQSFNQHWFGVPALGIILYRVYQLSKQQNIFFSQSNPKVCIRN